ncbi:MAG: hypothetical protein V1749_00260, partial [Candidatus Desantisbacteria bacterium]
ARFQFLRPLIESSSDLGSLHGCQFFARSRFFVSFLLLLSLSLQQLTIKNHWWATAHPVHFCC